MPGISKVAYAESVEELKEQMNKQFLARERAPMKLLKLASPYQLYISGDNLLVESATSGVCHTSIIL